MLGGLKLLTLLNGDEYRDHLGNLRLSFRDSLAAPVGGVYKPPVVVQANDYDPWGVVLDQISFVNNQNKINNFDYSNRERQTEFGLNLMALGARMYDPTIARFWSVDPITDGQENYSPFQYGWNNPISNNDPNGLCPSCPQGDEATKLYAVGAIVTNKDGSWRWTGSGWESFAPSSNNRGEDPAGAQVMEPVSGFWGWTNQLLNDNRRYHDGREVDSKGILTNRFKPVTGTPPSFSIVTKATTIAWSSARLARLAKELANGKLTVKVANRAEAEELFLRLFQGKGYRNTTGMSGTETKNFFEKTGIYHWDDVVDDAGTIINHSATNAHGTMKHLQIHDELGKVIRIFFE